MNTQPLRKKSPASGEAGGQGAPCAVPRGDLVGAHRLDLGDGLTARGLAQDGPIDIGAQFLARHSGQGFDVRAVVRRNAVLGPLIDGAVIPHDMTPFGQLAS
jgi:hypothetical protein